MNDDQKPGETSKGTTPAKTPKEIPKDEPRDKPKDDSLHEGLGGPPKKGSRGINLPEDKDEKSFSDLYSDIRKNWGSLLKKRKSTGTSRPQPERSSEPEIYLKREIGLCHSLNYLVLVTIGTGVYLAPSTVLERTDSVLESLLVWFFSGLFSLLIAVTYGELLFLVSQSGERFSFLLTAFSPFHPFFGPLPAFVIIWIDGVFLAPAQVSMLSLLLAENIYIPFSTHLKTYGYFELSEPEYVKQVIGIFVVVLITCVNFRTIATCLRIHLVLGVCKAFIIVFVMGSGVYCLNEGCTDSFQNMTSHMKYNVTGIIKAMYEGMWAYEGWNNVVTVSEETKNPLWTVPRAIFIGIPLVIFLYISMNIAFLSVLTANEIVAASTTYITKFEEKLFGSRSMIMPTFFALSALSCAMCIQLGTARTFFAAGREGHMPEVHSYLNIERFVPTPALLTQALLSLLYISYIPIIDLIQYSKFITWTFYGFAFMALITLRIKEPDTYRLYKTPICMPIISTTISILVTLDPVYRPDRTAFYNVLKFIICGVIVYSLTVYRQRRLFCMDRFNKLVRTVLNVAPPTALPEGYAHSSSRSESVAKKLEYHSRYYSYEPVIDIE